MERTRIVIVEDQPAMLRSLRKALSTFPELELIGTAGDGEAAVERITELVPDLVLLDLELPGLDGLQVTRKLKLRRVSSEILILTSFDDEQKVYEAMQAGAAGYLVKRVGPEKIRSAIAQVMEGGVVLEPIIARRFWNHFHSLHSTATKAQQNPWGLSEAEIGVLQFVAKGLSNAEVGQALAIERRTVRTHLGHIYRKMNVATHVDAVVLGIRSGLLES